MKKHLILILTLATCILLSACAVDDATLEKIQAGADRMHYAKSYKTTILVTFNSENDIEAFEKRLDVLALTVEEKEEQDGKIQYKLVSHYNIYEYILDELVLAQTSSVDIVNSEGNVVISEGMCVFEFRGSYAFIEVPQEIFDKYEYYEICNFEFRLNKVVYDTICGTRELDGKNYLDVQRYIKAEEPSKIVRLVLGISGVQLEEDVKIEVVN